MRPVQTHADYLPLWTCVVVMADCIVPELAPDTLAELASYSDDDINLTLHAEARWAQMAALDRRN